MIMAVDLTPSNFGHLNDEQEELARKHDVLRAGQDDMNHQLVDHGRQLFELTITTEMLVTEARKQKEALAANTTTTNEIKDDTKVLISLINDGKATYRIGSLITRAFVKVGIPGTILFGGYKAFIAWMQHLGPK